MNGNGHGPRQLIPLGFRAEDNRQQYRCQCCGLILVESLQFAPNAATSSLQLSCGKCKTLHTWTVGQFGIDFRAIPTAQGHAYAMRQYQHDRSPRIDRSGD